MSGKAHLTLMEQVIMILVFSVAAAICLQGFSRAHRVSVEQEQRGYAVTAAQNAAETLKYYRGDYTRAAQRLGGRPEAGNWVVFYDREWNPVAHPERAVFSLRARPVPSGDPGVGASSIQVFREEKLLFELTAGWQEVDAP